MNKFIELAKKYWWVLAILAVIIIYTVFFRKRGKYYTLAQCISKSGAKFYGSKSCPKCNAQKQLFGADASSLPFIHCENADRTLIPECKAAGVTKYPTWVFSNGKRTEGQILSINQLAQMTGCAATN